MTVETIAETLDKKYGNTTPSETIAEALGGQKGMLISEAVNVLNSVVFSTDIAANKDLLGKKVADLQEDVAILGRRFTGTLKYVTGYTGFSGDPAEQEGNYLVFKAVPPTGMTIGTDIIIKVNGTALDSDGHIILIMKSKKKIVVTVAKEGYETVLFELDPSALVCEPKDESVEDTVEPSDPEPSNDPVEEPKDDENE